MPRDLNPVMIDVEAESMKSKKPAFAKKIEGLQKALGLNTQDKFAEKAGVSQPTISAWLRGDNRRPPSAEAYCRFAMLAPDAEMAIWFLKQAGLDENAILVLAAKLSRDRMKEAGPPIESGKVFPIPRFREAAQGREEAGPPVHLPAEFLPNPALTICLVVDGKATAVVDSPEGMFILDESEKDASGLLPFSGQEVFAKYSPVGNIWYDAIGLRPGIYAGRVAFEETGLPEWDMPVLLSRAQLHPLTKLSAGHLALLGYWMSPSFPNFLDVRQVVKGEFNPEQIKDAMRAQKSAGVQMQAEPRLLPTWRILGRILGRIKLQK